MSLLAGLSRAVVREQPFPHLIVENVMSSAERTALATTQPRLLANSLSWQAVADDADISAPWKALVAEAITPQLLVSLLERFGPAILRTYPGFTRRFGPLNQLEGVPHVARQFRRRHTIALDAQLTNNLPTKTLDSAAEMAQLAWPSQLFIGLLFLCPDGATSGTNLEFYETLEAQPAFDRQRAVPRERVRLSQRVPCRDNSMVLFLNTPRSLYGVSTTAASTTPCYCLHMVGEMTEPIFQVPVVRGPGSEVKPPRARAGLLHRVRQMSKSA